MMKKIDDFLKKKEKYRVDVVIDYFEKPVIKTFSNVNVHLNYDNIVICGISKVNLKKNNYKIKINENNMVLKNQFVNNQLIIS
jgi:predicted alpha-1,6-mannanase (GH76 family)